MVANVKRQSLWWIVVSLLVVAACGQDGAGDGDASGDTAPTTASSASEGEEIVLRFPSWQADDPGTMGWWNARIEAFEEEHPNVTIELVKVALGDHVDKLLTEFVGGAPPEIVHLPVTAFFEFADRGFLEPLDGYEGFDEVDANWTPLQSTCEWEGSSYCVVMLDYGYGMIYNEDLLQQAGFDSPPTTPDELFEASVAISGLAEDTFGYGAVTAGGAPSANHFNVWRIGHGGSWTDDSGELAIDSPENAEAFGNWYSMVEAGAAPVGLDSSALRQLLVEGKLGFFFDGPWIYGNVQTAPDGVREHLKAASLPFENVMGGASNVLAVPAGIDEDVKQLVWEFIQGGTTAEWQDEYAANVGGPPPRVGAMTDETKADLPFVDVYSAAAGEAINFVPVGLETQLNELDTLVAEQLEALVSSGKAVEQVLADLESGAAALRDG